jgi:hypothetical protein
VGERDPKEVRESEEELKRQMEIRSAWESIYEGPRQISYNNIEKMKWPKKT